MTPLHAAGLAKRFRSQARTARLAGHYTHAAALYRMAATTQARAVADDFGAAA